MIKKIKTLASVRCPKCDTALIAYRPIKPSLQTLLQLRYRCAHCHKAFVLPSWVMWLFIALFIVLYGLVRSPLSEAAFLTLAHPLIVLAKTKQIGITTFLWGIFAVVGITYFLLMYCAIRYGVIFIRSQLIAISTEELEGWTALHSLRKAINDLKDIKNFPMWQKIVAVVYTLAVLGLVAMSSRLL